MPSRIAAHRGGALEAPENTVEAIRYVASLGVEEVEIDLHLSADGHMMVHHDATLDRMTDGTGPLAAYPAAELQRLRVAGSATASIPTFDDALAALDGSALTLRLELKPDQGGRMYPGLAEKAVAALAQHGWTDRSYISSFTADYLRAPQIVESGMVRMLLVEGSTFNEIGRLDGLARILDLIGVTDFALPIWAIDTELVDMARARGLVLSAFGCHREAQISAALALDLPVFTSDRPTLARDLRRCSTS